MKSISRFFIRRPIASVMLALAVVLAGALAWRALPVAPLPAVEFPMIMVNATLPGAGPESIAATVAGPLERALGSIAGVTKIQSSSNQGSTDVDLEFDLSRNIHDAARDVQAALNSVQGQLPSGMPSPPSYAKVNPSQAPIIALALNSGHLPAAQLYDTASTVLAPRLSQVRGVGEVSVEGASLPAVRVQLDAARLTHLGLSMDDVRQAIADANAWRPLGAVEDGRMRWQVSLPSPVRSAAAFSDLVVRSQDGRSVRLSDVAEVSDSVENRYTSGYHNNRPAVVLQVSRRTDANIVETTDAIHALMPQLRALLPPGAELRIVMDRSPGIRATLDEAQIALGLACLLVMAVVWGFIGNWRAALVPALALPVSLIGGFAVMWAFGFSLNNLSLMALIVATGLVVDDAIVVLENVQRHLERHGGHATSRFAVWRAALRGAGEVGHTLLAMTLALVAVFVSTLFMGGVIERLFREFSLTLAAVMLISLAVSVSLTPALCAHGLLRGGPDAARPSLGQRAFEQVRIAYMDSLDRALRHPVPTLMLLVAAVGLTAWLYVDLPKSMLPRQDTGQLAGLVRGDDGFSFQVMQPKVEAFRQLLIHDPAVADVTGTSGGSGGVSNSWFRIRLKPRAERGESADRVAARLRRSAPKVPGGLLMVFVDQDLELFDSGGDGEQMFALRSDSLETLREWGQKVGRVVEDLPELVDVWVPGRESAQQVMLQVDREAAVRLGVRMETLASALNNAFAQRQVATIYDALNQYHVVMELDPRQGSEPAALERLQVLNDSGERVPLSNFASWRYALVPDRVFHDSQFAAVGIEYGLAPGVTPLQAQQAIDREVAKLMLPASIYTGPPTEDTVSLKSTLDRQPLLILGILITVYLTLGVLYESTLHPVTILSTLPSAGLGALLALWLSNTEFSLIALLGLFLLIGVVMKNAILMIDVALQAQRRDGLAPGAAIREAARQRLRPILMTNLAAICGALPLVMGIGEGSEMRRPLGVAIVGGLAVSQLLTLYTTPVIYLQLERLRQRVLHGRSPAPASAPT